MKRFIDRNKTKIEVTKKMVALFNETGKCRWCIPEACNGTSKYWRYDKAAPTIDHAATHYLSSIPEANRIPASEIWGNLSYFFDQDENRYPQRLYLFDFNPSIVQIPANYSLPDTLGEKPVYLASYRVSHQHNCFGEDGLFLKMYGGTWKIAKKIKKDNKAKAGINYLGLALLREDLSVISDTVVTLKFCCSDKSFGHYQDYRLFALGETIYLTSNEKILPLALTANGDPDYKRLNYVFKTDRGFPVWARVYATCVVHKGKNLQYFIDGNGTLVMEYYPSNPHEVNAVDLKKRCILKEAIEEHDDSKIALDPPRSFATLEELHYPYLTINQLLFSAHRGSACCVTIKDASGKEYFVGVSHPKTVFPNSRLPEGLQSNIYLSCFYAFEKYPPYQIVARSGLFCFGYSREDTGNPMWNRTTAEMHFGEWFNCPKIHFVLSIIEKAGDDSKVIISYGVSDCLSRFVEVDKFAIARMLWGEPGV
jgi:hypothetical protein